MKIIFIIFFLLFSKSILANDDDGSLEVIKLHDNKSLDQMVLDNLNVKEQIQEVSENSNEIIKIETDEVEETQIVIEKNNFIFQNETNDLKLYFDNLLNIKSETLHKEIVAVLENLQLNFELEQDKEIFFLIVNYLKSIGQINKSYELIERFELNNDKNFKFYTEIKLNYLLSTFQLNEACNFKEEINSNLKLDYFFLEKLDIFCLILNDNQLEASLLNSILIESENNTDNYYQYLFSLISNTSDQTAIQIEFKNTEINKDLIFLYSAMTRIAELPFSDEFYQLDKKNLSIPIILNQASPINLRIKAANDSFLENLISVESLAALYMSADFNSDQLNNPQKTIETFSSDIELSMAFLFQLVNI